MERRLLFVMDPIERILPDKDTTFVLMLESQARGHAIYYCAVTDLFVTGCTAHARFRRAAVARDTPHYRHYEARTEPLSWFDAVFMRKDPPVDPTYLFATHILSLVDASSTFLIN